MGVPNGKNGAAKPVGFAFLLLVTPASAATYQVIGQGRGVVLDVLQADAAGRLYGMDAAGSGAVFRLALPQALHVFSAKDKAGEVPAGGVTLADDALFGTSEAGGVAGFGTVWRLEAGASMPTVLHAFAWNDATPADGAMPVSGLTAGPGHLLYGATLAGGTAPVMADERKVAARLAAGGTVFAVSPSATAPKYTVLHRFGRPGDGASPTGGRLAVNAAGQLFGATHLGGSANAGTVYRLVFAQGGWREQVLHSFGTDGGLAYPPANVVLDRQGNVYGCANGGAAGKGGIFRLAPPDAAAGAWTMTVPVDFAAAPAGPSQSTDRGCGVAIDPATGHVVGTTTYGGAYGKGTIFELAPGPVPGGWSLTLIHSFDGSDADGAYPVAPPAQVNGVWYGGTSTGTIYAFTP